jgi:hypothetical protein
LCVMASLSGRGCMRDERIALILRHSLSIQPFSSGMRAPHVWTIRPANGIRTRVLRTAAEIG